MRTGDDLRQALVEIDSRRTDYLEDKPPGPWELQAAGEQWAYATDGMVLVAVLRHLVPGDCTRPPERIGTSATRWVEQARHIVGQPIQATVLSAFAGVVVNQCSTCDGARTVECDDCDGSGSHDCECLSCGDCHTADCRTCKGDGEQRCPDCPPDAEDERAAQFLGAVINRPLLSAVLSAIQPDSDVIVSLEDIITPLSGKNSCYLLRPASDTPSWVAVQMPMAKHVSAKAIFEDRATWGTLEQPRTDDAVDPVGEQVTE